MKKLKSIVAVLLIGTLLLPFGGCTVNKEKDMASTVLKIEKQTYTKQDFIDYLNYLLLQYKVYYNSDIRDDEAAYENYKETAFENYTNYQLMAYAAKDMKLKVDEKEAVKTTDTVVTAVKEALVGKKGTDKAFEEALKKYNFTSEKDLHAILDKISVNTAYVTALEDHYNEKLLGNKEYSSYDFMKVNGKTVPANLFYSYLLNQQLTDNANQTTQPQSEEEYKNYYESIMKTLAADVAYVQAGEERKIKLTSEEIKTEEDNQAYLETAYGKSTVLDYAKTFGLNEKLYNQGKTYRAKAALYKTKIQEAVEKSVKVTDKEVKKYYDDNQANYSSATVSAKHILVSDKSQANAILKEIKKKNFTTIFANYASSEDVIEASDLGEFKYGDMVKEFSEAAFDAKKDEVVGPVKSTYGYHIIYVYDKKDGKVSAYKDVKDQVKKDLTASKKTEEAAAVQQEIQEDYKLKKLHKKVEMPFDLYLASLKEQYSIKDYAKKALR